MWPYYTSTRVSFVGKHRWVVENRPFRVSPGRLLWWLLSTVWALRIWKHYWPVRKATSLVAPIQFAILQPQLIINMCLSALVVSVSSKVTDYTLGTVARMNEWISVGVDLCGCIFMLAIPVPTNWINYSKDLLGNRMPVSGAKGKQVERRKGDKYCSPTEP